MSFLLVSLFAFFVQPAIGQPESGAANQASYVESDSAQGHWRLKTQADTRTTRVEFFGPNQQLLYQETLPGKWVRLSRKNQKQFDALLKQLLANQLVASRIKTETLPPDPAESKLPVGTAATGSFLNQTFLPATAPYQVHAYVTQAGKLRVNINNPNRLRYAIKLVDKKNQPYYEEFTNLSLYRRNLDISALYVDAYQLIIQFDDQPIRYMVRKQSATLRYDIQPLLVGNVSSAFTKEP